MAASRRVRGFREHETSLVVCEVALSQRAARQISPDLVVT